MNTPVVKILFKKNYLAMVRNAGKGHVHLFRNLWASVDGVETDILQDGQIGCAVFVSAVLYTQNSVLEDQGSKRWISFTHATVASTEKDLAESGWIQIPEHREGAVVTWEPIQYDDGTSHLHIGFFVGNGRAISMSTSSGVPVEHDASYNGTRKIIRNWWHPVLNEA